MHMRYFTVIAVYSSAAKCQKTPGAKFSTLFRKIFGRLLFQRKYADFRNFFGKCLEEFEKIYQRRF